MQRPKLAKTILITGTSSGVGKHIALSSLKNGHKVYGISRRASRISHANFTEVLQDLKKPLPKLSFKDEIDCLILNAGIGHFKHLEELSDNQILEMLEVNLIANINLVKAFLPSLKKMKQAHLIYIGSEAALKGEKKGSVYSATKFAMRGFMQSIRQECATSNVQVTCIQPGMIDTPFYQDKNFSPGDAPENSIDLEDIDSIIAMLLQMRAGTNIDEIALSPLKKVIKKKKEQKILPLETLLASK